MSSGYGKGVAVVKKKRAPDTPTFQPDPSIVGKAKKKEVMSSGYGKGLVEKKASVCSKPKSKTKTENLFK